MPDDVTRGLPRGEPSTGVERSPGGNTMETRADQSRVSYQRARLCLSLAWIEAPNAPSLAQERLDTALGLAEYMSEAESHETRGAAARVAERIAGERVRHAAAAASVQRERDGVLDARAKGGA